MQKLIIIGNTTADPVTRTVSSGSTVCSFNIAVNRQKEGVDYFRCSAWNRKGEIIQQYASKGKKMCVVGSVSVSVYEGKDGKPHANLEVLVDDFEFLSPKEQQGACEPSDADDSGFDDFDSKGFLDGLDQ